MINSKQSNASPFSDLMQEFTVYGDAILSRNGSSLGGFDLSGIEPDATTTETRERLTLSLTNFFEMLPDTVNCVQYYVKLSGYEVTLKDREQPMASLLTSRRQRYLNKQNLVETKLLHLFESRRDVMEDVIDSSAILKDLIMFPVSPESRERLKNRMSVKGNVLQSLKTIEQSNETLNTAMHEASEYFENYMNVDRLSPCKIAHFLGFLCSLDKSFFDYNQFQEDHLSDGLPDIVASTIIDSVKIGGTQFIRFSGSETRYARILSLSQYITEKIRPGYIVGNILNPLMVDGNFILMNRYKPMTDLVKPEYFRQRRVEVEQKNVDITSLLKGTERLNEVDKKTIQKKSIKDRLDQIDVEENIDAKHGLLNCHVLLFDKDPERVNKNCKNMVSAFTRIGARMVYEDTLRKGALKTFFPCSQGPTIRDIKTNSAQFGASSLIYKASVGKKIIEDYGNEEYLYPFKSKDGTPFYYSPFVNGRGLVLMIGPIRSGKSFFRKTVASHFTKYNGFIRMVDPDPGSEKIARLFGDDGGIFRIDPEKNAGFNLFSTCLGPDDIQFQEHFLWAIDYLLSLNAAKDMRRLTKNEQIEVDRWLKRVMSYEEKKLQTLFSFYNHCSIHLKEKLARFVRGGVYGSICDCDIDAVHGIEKPVAAFNVHGIKDMKQMLPFSIYEIFFRIRRLFENPDYRQRAKLADIDEAHLFLKIPGTMEMLSTNVRTWGKWLGSLSLTTQSPQELFQLDDWSMFRSSSSTWIFFADPQIDLALYQDAFQLTESEMTHISRLKPRGEAYIIQREIGVSKTIVIDVEAEQYVINTSKASEEQMTIDDIEKYGPIDGVEKSIKKLGLKVTE